MYTQKENFPSDLKKVLQNDLKIITANGEHRTIKTFNRTIMG